jgi:hypothetical protein
MVQPLLRHEHALRLPGHHRPPAALREERPRRDPQQMGLLMLCSGLGSVSGSLLIMALGFRPCVAWRSSPAWCLPAARW